MFRLKLHLHGAPVETIELLSGRVYTFGRGASCDVQLEEQPGISRNHFRVSDEQGTWTVQVTSKFGDVIFGGQPVQTIPLESGMAFKLGNYDFRFEEKARQESGAFETSSNVPATIQKAVGQSDSSSIVHANTSSALVPSHGNRSSQQFDGNDEATRVMQVEVEIPYLRIVEPGGVEDLIKLDGRRWIAGREDGSSILLNDKKASRRQFELTSTPQGYFVRDLASSNGTLLNGMPLQPDELKPLRSGDVLQVGSVLLHFEVRDPNFEKRLMVVPHDVRSEAPIVLHNTYEMINYPVASGPGGAVRIPATAESKNKLISYALGDDLQDEPAKKKRRSMVAVAIFACFFAVYSMMDSGPKKVVVIQETGFAKLTPTNQKVVKETYVLAKNLFMQKKLALAADQLAKIHTILPEGYQSSLAMAADCQDAAILEENLRFIEEQKKKQEETNRIISDTLAKCDRLAKSTLDPEELRTCMAPALERAPGDPRVVELQQKVDRRIAERNQDLQNARNRNAAVAKGRALFKKAEAYERGGQDLDAIDTYKSYLSRGFPDPDGLKESARKNMLSLTQRLSSKVDDALHSADSAFGSQNYKEALTLIKKAKALDPLNEKAAEMNARFRRELKAKLKELYEESIITEGIGDVEQAKTKWKKILEMDLPEGEYYGKAKSKLRSYGAN